MTPWWLLAAATLAGAPPAPLAPPPAAGVDVIETIEETTVGDLGGVPVPMGNMFVDTYTLPDGTSASGLVCALALECARACARVRSRSHAHSC